MVSLALALPAMGASQSQGPEAAYNAAMETLQAGRVGVARSMLEAVVEQWPRHLRANYQLGRLALERGEMKTARNYLEVATEGEFPGVFSAWFQLGRTCQLERDFDAAIAAFDQAIERAPDFGPAYTERGRALLFEGEIEAGLAALERAADLAGGWPQAAMLALQLLVETDRTEAADAILDSLLASMPSDPEQAAEVRWLEQALEPTSDGYRRLLLEVAGHADAATLYWALGSVARSLNLSGSPKLFVVALDLDSENPAIWMALRDKERTDAELPAALPSLGWRVGLARRLLTDQRTAEAVEQARALVEERSHLVPGWLVLAEASEALGEPWRALSIYQQLIEWIGEVPGFDLDVARVAETLGAFDLAACAIERAHRQGLDDPRSWYLQARIEKERDRLDDAVEACRRAVEDGFDDVRVWLLLGDLYFRQMRITESIGAFERAMEIDPLAAEEVRPFALSSLTTEQFDSLRRLLERHVAARPESLETLYALGIMSLREDRLAEARDYLERLAELAPNHLQVHYNLGQVYLRQGETAAGKAEMDRFRQLKAAEDAEWERHNQAHFRRLAARQAEGENDLEQAANLLEQSIADGTAESSDYLELAEVYLRSGDPDRAMELFGNLLAQRAADRTALTGMMQAAAAAGDETRRNDAAHKLELLDWPCMMTPADNGPGP